MAGHIRPRPLRKVTTRYSATKAAGPAYQFHIAYPHIWLSLAAFAVYLPTLSMGETDLDDAIAISSKHDFNENLANLFLSFGKTIFNTTQDILYRPIATDVMLLNYQLAGHGQNIALYHLVSVLLHIACVSLLYRLLVRLEVPALHAFLLSMVFAVHPVLTEAVAWISARVETILAIFVLAFLIRTIDYSRSGKPGHLVTAALMLLLALFSKETAVASAPAAMLILLVALKTDWKDRRNLAQYAVWAACYGIWLAARTYTVSGHLRPGAHGFLADAWYRVPATLQYLGKIFIPANLSVYPLQEDTVYYYGIIAILLLAALLAFSRRVNRRIAVTGMGIFLLFIAPTFFIPRSVNVQLFEYRLYLPLTGILLMLSQAMPLHSSMDARKLFAGGIAICMVLAGINLGYQRHFADPLAFWAQAEHTSPHSAYAKMMLSARLNDPVRGEQLFLEAYRVNPNERLLNFIYGVRLQEKDSILESEKYFLAEKKISGYYQCDLYLAQVAMARKDTAGAISYLEHYVQSDPRSTLANNNLLVLYLDTDQDDKARQQAQNMKARGMDLPRAVLEHFKL